MSSAHVRKVHVRRQQSRQGSDKNYIKNNLESVREISSSKPVESIVLPDKKKEFKIETSLQNCIKKSKFTLQRELDVEFLEIRKKDLKLQEKLQKVILNQALKKSAFQKRVPCQRNVYGSPKSLSKKNIGKESRNSRLKTPKNGTHSELSVKKTLALRSNLPEIPKEQVSLGQDKEQVSLGQDREEITVYKEKEEIAVYKDKEEITLYKDKINQHNEEIYIQEQDLDEEDLDEEDLDEEKDILYLENRAKEITLKEKELRISSHILENIVQGKEDFYINGNYLKKFGIYGGNKGKFWDLLKVLSRDILHDILEISLNNIVEICDEMVQDLIQDEFNTTSEL